MFCWMPLLTPCLTVYTRVTWQKQQKKRFVNSKVQDVFYCDEGKSSPDCRQQNSIQESWLLLTALHVPWTFYHLLVLVVLHGIGHNRLRALLDGLRSIAFIDSHWMLSPKVTRYSNSQSTYATHLQKKLMEHFAGNCALCGAIYTSIRTNNVRHFFFWGTREGWRVTQHV